MTPGCDPVDEVLRVVDRGLEGRTLALRQAVCIGKSGRAHLRRVCAGQERGLVGEDRTAGDRGPETRVRQDLDPGVGELLGGLVLAGLRCGLGHVGQQDAHRDHHDQQHDAGDQDLDEGHTVVAATARRHQGAARHSGCTQPVTPALGRTAVVTCRSVHGALSAE